MQGGERENEAAREVRTADGSAQKSLSEPHLLSHPSLLLWYE